MRELVKEDTSISELIEQINSVTSTKTFYLDDKTKITVTLLKRCTVCKQWFRNSDIEKLDDLNACWSCVGTSKKIGGD